MKSGLRIAVLSAVTAAALVYVVLERPGQTPSAAQPANQASTPVWEPPATTPSTRANFSNTDVPEAPEPPAAPEIDSLTEDERNNVEVYTRYSRGVVNITSTTYSYDFFLRPVPESGSGSGVVIDEDGHIVTNYHVIENAVESPVRFQTAPSEIEVTLWDQSHHQAQVVGIDPTNDLAVLQVEADVRWVPIPFGSAEGLKVGQKVLAIGNPFGLERTLTTGIVSSLGRAIEATNGRVIEGIIQTDAAINRGNSGGPLLNTRGEVIGINTAIVAGASGIGFAVPVETVRRVSADLLTYGRVRRADLGLDERGLVNLSSLGSDLVAFLDLGTDSGVMAASIPGDSPAADAGIRGARSRIRVGNYLIPADGDIIVRIADRAINTSADIGTVLEAYRPGDDVDITVIRDKNPVTLKATLGEDSGR